MIHRYNKYSYIDACPVLVAFDDKDWENHGRSVMTIAIYPFLSHCTQHSNLQLYIYGGFLKWGYPQIIHFRLGFSLTKAIELLGYRHFRKPPYLYLLWLLNKLILAIVTSITYIYITIYIYYIITDIIPDYIYSPPTHDIW